VVEGLYLSVKYLPFTKASSTRGCAFKYKEKDNGMLYILCKDQLDFGQSEPAPTSAPTWMDGALIGFSFPVPSQVDFFSLPFLSPDLSFYLHLYFLPGPHLVSFF